MDRLERLQHESKTKWIEHRNGVLKWWVKKNEKSSVLTFENPEKEKTNPIRQRPAYMEYAPLNHFLKSMEHIGLEFFQYKPPSDKRPVGRPKKVKPVGKVDWDKVNAVEAIVPVVKKKIYKKRNDPPEKTITERPPAEYSNKSIYDKYGV